MIKAGVLDILEKKYITFEDERYKRIIIWALSNILSIEDKE